MNQRTPDKIAERIANVMAYTAAIVLSFFALLGALSNSWQAAASWITVALLLWVVYYLSKIASSLDRR